MTQTNHPPVITIDGPSGAGKGTLCRLVAQATGYTLLDSGSLYRLTGLQCDKGGVDMSDLHAVADVAKNLDIEFVAEDDGTIVLLAGENVSADIRQEKIGMLASKVGANSLAREALLERQRAFRQRPGLVADGRDMGTVVFPDAEVKIFLTASAQERARRRVLQLEQAGHTAEFEVILKDIEERDYADMNRTVAPLAPADDATEVDCTAMTIPQVLERIMALVNRAVAK